MPVLFDQSIVPLLMTLLPVSIPDASGRNVRLPAPEFAMVVPVATETSWYAASVSEAGPDQRRLDATPRSPVAPFAPVVVTSTEVPAFRLRCNACAAPSSMVKAGV